MSEATSRPHIRLDSSRVEGGDIEFEASIDKPLARYFKAARLRMSYDAPLESVDSSLTAIPFVATVIAVAWATGADIELPTIDRRFLESLEAVRKVMKSWYPRLPFSSKIWVGETRSAGPRTGGGEGLLYSGGLDSTASLIRHLDSRPVLMLVLGTPDLPADQQAFQRIFLERVGPFIGQLGLKMHVIRSGMLEMVDLEALNEDFGASIHGYWWESIGHGIMLLGACAPLTVIDGVGTLRIAASRTSQFEEPWGSNPETDEQLAWGRTSVVHDSHDVSRQQKIDSLIAPFSRKTAVMLPLRVCGSTKDRGRLARQTLNCERCEKCVRTIVGLLAAGLDPKTCGFDMKYFSAESLRRGLESGSLKLPKSVWDLWFDIQSSVRKQGPNDDVPEMYGSRSFFEWIRGHNLEKNLYKPSWVTRALGESVPRFSSRRRSIELVREFGRASTEVEVS